MERWHYFCERGREGMHSEGNAERGVEIRDKLNIKRDGDKKCRERGFGAVWGESE
jgi:hypothetical protein